MQCFVSDWKQQQNEPKQLGRGSLRSCLVPWSKKNISRLSRSILYGSMFHNSIERALHRSCRSKMWFNCMIGQYWQGPFLSLTAGWSMWSNQTCGLPLPSTHWNALPTSSHVKLPARVEASRTSVDSWCGDVALIWSHEFLNARITSVVLYTNTSKQF